MQWLTAGTGSLFATPLPATLADLSGGTDVGGHRIGRRVRAPDRACGGHHDAISGWAASSAV